MQVIIDCSRRTADTSPVYTAQAPGWARLDEALQEASRAAAAWGQAHGSLQPVSAEAISSTAAQWSDSVEQALESSLLWAQGVSAAHANSAGEPCCCGYVTSGLTHMSCCPLSCQSCRMRGLPWQIALSLSFQCLPAASNGLTCGSESTGAPS